MDPAEIRIDFALLIACLLLGVMIAAFLVTVLRYQRKRRRAYLDGLEKELRFIEEDRARIADDLHDALGSALSAVKLRLQVLSPAGSAELEMIGHAETSLDKAIQSLRRLPGEHAPQFLTQRGLKAALEEYLEQVAATAGFRLETSIQSLTLPDPVALTIYRLIQETIHNIGKHAEATIVVVQLSRDDDVTTLMIRDNGRGFDLDKALATGKGMGLRSIRTRADALRASVQLDTAPGKGTTYMIEIPV